MFFLYNAVLIILIILLSPMICIILLLRRKYRCGFLQKIGFLPWTHVTGKLQSKPIWVHAVSVGEVMATIPLIKEIKKCYPHIPVVLSTVTETGHFTAQRNAKGFDHVLYFPFDFPWIVKKAISNIQPLMFLTLETEIWPNFLRELKRQGIPSMMVSGRISQNSFRSYFFFRVFFKKVLSMISFFCMQTEMDRKRILDIGADHKKTIVTGSIKFDQQLPAITVEENEEIYRALNLKPEQNIFIAGSTHKGEEELIVSVFQELKNKVPDLIMILAPRHPERFEDVALLLKQTCVDFIRKTELASKPGYNLPPVILLDTIGELSKIYSIGTIIYIGGSLVPVGGHNVLEPAVFSKPVIFGNYMGNFSEIASILIEKDAAIRVSNRDEFAEQALALLNNKAHCRQIGESAFAVIRENSGAVKRSVDILQQFLDC